MYTFGAQNKPVYLLSEVRHLLQNEPCIFLSGRHGGLSQFVLTHRSVGAAVPVQVADPNVSGRLKIPQLTKITNSDSEPFGQFLVLSTYYLVLSYIRCPCTASPGNHRARASNSLSGSTESRLPSEHGVRIRIRSNPAYWKCSTSGKENLTQQLVNTYV
jgi:hypothetical protein